MRILRTLPVFFLSLMLFAACGDVGDAPEAETGDAVATGTAAGMQLAIDTSQSEINWRGAKVTRHHDGGFHNFSGTVTVDGEQVTGVDVTIDVNSLWSDSERLTGHLKTGDFFEVETYPTATFEATQFAPSNTEGSTHTVTGNLTMHGQTHGVTFPATIEVEDGTVRAEADFIINRRTWGINYDGMANDLIEDDVRIMFNLTAGA